MKILLADDQLDIRSALRILLEQEDGLHVVGEAADLNSLITQIKIHAPDLILLDWELTNLEVLTGIPLLQQLLPRVKIIALSSWPEASKSALNAGVDAFVSKGDHPEKLLETIRRFN